MVIALSGRPVSVFTIANPRCGVCVGAQNRAEFEEMLEKALAVDPDAVPELRLANTVSQRRAAWLLARADELFLE